MVVRPSLGDKPGCNFFANVKKTNADSHTGQKKAGLQFPAPFGNNKLFKMSLDV